MSLTLGGASLTSLFMTWGAGEGTLLVQGWQVNRWCAAWQGQHPTQKGRGMENSLPPPQAG